MVQENKGATLLGSLVIYVPLFIAAYLGVMLVKYWTNDDLTWLRTFVMMFSIAIIYFILRRTTKKKLK
ncbi:hypothetical protein NCCP2716_28460 [Sporosarcina sp. NCCP-2716]|uniref:hypothetical protein n=1 Tax=Sporosarcina sp. NCCP-2716 TaxID=2943679 RepID=UPI002041E72B|nr:hypothetical protein [Sporosarcina sp. NCCP-2716]GKV70348.1 hypothetical protein NCCP2716_28460 [Sporosarcina sp. NCCP-2716]